MSEGEPVSQREAAMLFERARAHAEAGRQPECRAVVAELVARCEHDTDPAVRRIVCRALFGQAKGRLAEGVDRRGVIVDYRHILHIADRPPRIDDVAASAIYHLALTHGKIAIERASDEHREKAEERFVDLERRFSAAREPGVAYWVARGSMTHALTRELDAAGPLYERVVARYSRDPDIDFRAYAVTALTQWAERCAVDGQTELATTLRARAAAIDPPGG